MSILGRFSGRKFAAALVRNQVDGVVKRLAEDIGPRRLAWLVDNRKDLKDLLPPEVEDQYRRQAPPWSEAASSITDQEIVEMLPPWAVRALQERGELGQEWIERQLAWIRSFFGGRV